MHTLSSRDFLGLFLGYTCHSLSNALLLFLSLVDLTLGHFTIVDGMIASYAGLGGHVPYAGLGGHGLLFTRLLAAQLAL